MNQKQLNIFERKIKRRSKKLIFTRRKKSKISDKFNRFVEKNVSDGLVDMLNAYVCIFFRKNCSPLFSKHHEFEKGLKLGGNKLSLAELSRIWQNWVKFNKGNLVSEMHKVCK